MTNVTIGAIKTMQLNMFAEMVEEISDIKLW